MSAPWLSVIMPTYNGAAYLPQALASLRAAAVPGVEVVAVDDGSTDGTVELLEQYGRDHSVVLIRREHRGNWVASSNLALAAARGEYACFLHQDDLWLPDRLRVLRPLVAAHRAAPLFAHPVWFIGPGGRRLGRWNCALPSARGLLTSSLVTRRLLVQNCFAAPAPLFRRNLALATGGMDEHLWYTADWDFWLKLAAEGETVYVSRPLAAFRIHPLSQTSLRTADGLQLRWQLETVLNRHLPTLRNDPRAAQIASVARLSVECNLWLAACRGSLPSLGPLLQAVFSVGPSDLFRYVRDSSILARVWARLRLVLQEGTVGRRVTDPIPRD